MNDDIKLAFIADALSKYMTDVIAEMRNRMRSLKTIDTRQLFNSLSYRVHNSSSRISSQLNFSEWGRFLDMGVTRSHPLGGIDATIQALSKDSPNKIKARQIYSPVAYGHLNWLIGYLQYGMSDEVIDNLKKTLQNNV